MKIERFDIYDFKITLTQVEWDVLRRTSDEANVSPEAALKILLGDVIRDMLQVQCRKDNADGLERKG